MGTLLKILGFLFLVVILVTVSCGVGVAIGAAMGGDDGFSFGRPAVGVVYVEGQIVGGRSSGLFDAVGAYSDSVIADLRRAERDPSVKAIVLRVDSPGGGVTASDEIRNELIKLTKKKPVVASFGALAASGGYYISAPTNKIVSNETTLTGSIGVITVIPNVQGLMEKLGVEVSVLTSGPHKDETTGLRPLTDADREILQSIVNESYERFVTVVSEGRKMSKDDVRRMADGRIYTGRQALDLKLVDEIGDLPEAIQAAAQLSGIRGAPRVVRYRRGGGLFGGAVGMVEERLGLPSLPLPVGGASQPFSIQYLFVGP